MISPRGWQEPGPTPESLGGRFRLRVGLRSASLKQQSVSAESRITPRKSEMYETLGRTRPRGNRRHRFQANAPHCRTPLPQGSVTAHGYRHKVPVSEQIVARRGQNLFVHLSRRKPDALMGHRAYSRRCGHGHDRVAAGRRLCTTLAALNAARPPPIVSVGWM